MAGDGVIVRRGFYAMGKSGEWEFRFAFNAGSVGMVRKTFPLSRVYGLLETGPVVLVTTAHKGKANIMSNT